MEVQMNYRWLVLIALPLLGAAAPTSVNNLGLTDRDSSAPIQYAADSVDANSKSNTITATGNVIVTQGAMTLHTDYMLGDKAANTITAKGHVVFATPTASADGDNGSYDERQHLITLVGNVVLTHGKDVMRGSQLTVNLITGIYRVTSAPGTRVQGDFSASSATSLR
jgi:lipopolysaccharide export system protein LptA